MEAKLQAKIRAKSEKLDRDYLAAIVYGSGSENTLIKLKLNDFIKVYEQAGESNLIELDVESLGKIQVLIKEFQKDPIKGSFIHVDFYKVDMAKEVNAEIPLEFVGESRAVKELGALLIKNIDSLEIECLPKDLVDHIDVDISGLENFGDLIQVKDIKVSSGLKILNNLDDAVVSVTEAKEEVVKEEVVVTPEAEKDKPIEEKKD
ncbi:MAG: 50S ribosomal protein L25 [Patescibacteria group bacterium]|nr:50S ribosomal protein L25 [Patescibacteria group bacterium]